MVSQYMSYRTLFLHNKAYKIRLIYKKTIFTLLHNVIRHHCRKQTEYTTRGIYFDFFPYWKKRKTQKTENSDRKQPHGKHSLDANKINPNLISLLEKFQTKMYYGQTYRYYTDFGRFTFQ